MLKLFFTETQYGLSPRIGRLICALFGLIMSIVILFGTFYAVPEGHVAVERRFGKATVQTDPGLHMKVPFIDGYEEIEVRQRKNVEDLTAATQNQLPVVARVSINWTVDKSAAKDLFIEYGGLSQFENRVLDPKLRSSAKAAIAAYPADQLIKNRNVAVANIMEEMLKSTKHLPITINSPQIENIELPEQYKQAVMAKEQAREAAEQEKHNLERQRLIAEQKVQTAVAERKAAEEEARAIHALNKELSKSPHYIDLIRAKKWDGVLPKTIASDKASVLIGNMN